MTSNPNATATATLDDLQERLQRLEFFLSGSDAPQKPLEAAISQGRDYTITERMARLERKLNSMSEQSPVVHDLLQLRTLAVPNSPVGNCWLTPILIYYREGASQDIRILRVRSRGRPAYSIDRRDDGNRRSPRSPLPAHCLPAYVNP